MDTLHFEWPRRDRGSGRPLGADVARSEDANLSDVEVFMLRGRRLQAQTIGGLWHRAVGKLQRLLRRAHGGPGAPLPPGRSGV
jgi:hypothetical protein